MAYLSKLIIGLGLFSSFSLALAATIESYGDSLTAGFLSHTNVTNAPSLAEIEKTVSDLAMYQFTSNKKYLAPYEHPDTSWAGQVAMLMGKDFTLENYAVTGDETQDLYYQVLANPIKDKQAIAFFFIGHNDLCGNELSIAAIANQFYTEFNSALALWDSQHEGGVAYLVPMGAIHELYAVLDGYIWHEPRGLTLGCTDSWTKLFPYCRQYYKLQTEGKLDVHLKPRIDAMNEQLGVVAEHWSQISERNRFYYLSDVNSERYRPEYFAVDCFHLSQTGQNQLAQSIVQNMPAY